MRNELRLKVNLKNKRVARHAIAKSLINKGFCSCGDFGKEISKLASAKKN